MYILLETREYLKREAENHALANRKSGITGGKTRQAPLESGKAFSNNRITTDYQRKGT